MEYYNNVWYGGMSEDDFLGGDDKVLYSENINLTGNTQFIELNSKPTLHFSTLTHTPKQLIKVKDTVSNQDYIIAFCNDGNVYNSDGLAYTNTDLGNGEYPAFVMGDYLYFTTLGATNYILNRITIIDAISGTWGSPTLGYKTLSAKLSTGYEYWGVTLQAGKAFIWFGDKINKYLYNGATTTEFNLTGGEEIVGITTMPSGFKIYTETGKIAIWDGNETTISQIGTELNFALRKAYQIRGIDYIISGSVQGGVGLYYMNGLTPQVLTRKKFSRLLNLWKYDIQYNITDLTSYFDILFMIDNDGDNLKILSFGKELQGLPNAFNYTLSKNSYGNSITGQLNGIIVSGDYLYYGFYDGTNRGVDKIYIKGTGNRQNTGILTTTRQNLGNGLNLKTFTQLYTRVENITSTQYIEVYISVDGGDFTLLHTINEQPLDGIARIPVKGNFRDYSLKFVLNTNSSTSPRIYLPYKLNYELKGI